MKAVIFDMDGVIIDSEPIHFETDMETMKYFGCSILAKELEKYVGTTNEYMYTDIKRNFKLNQSLEEIINYRSELIKRKIMYSELKPIKGIKELLMELKRKNIDTAIASSSPKDFINTVINKFELQEYFKYIVSGEEVKKGKPYPDIYIETSKKLGVHANKCIVIEDSKNGILAAKAAGMMCIGFKNINSGNQDLSNADIIVNSIKEIKILDNLLKKD